MSYSVPRSRAASALPAGMNPPPPTSRQLLQGDASHRCSAHRRRAQSLLPQRESARMPGRYRSNILFALAIPCPARMKWLRINTPTQLGSRMIFWCYFPTCSALRGEPASRAIGRPLLQREAVRRPPTRILASAREASGLRARPKCEVCVLASRGVQRHRSAIRRRSFGFAMQQRSPDCPVISHRRRRSG